MSHSATFDTVPLLTAELDLSSSGIAAVIALLEEGGTVPFIARYRKEATGGLDEVQIRAIQERRAYLLELEQRRGVILESIAEQGKLTEELRGRIDACTTKAELEDLYLPYKPKRRTRATVARERGLEPLAQRILSQGSGDPRREATAFIDEEKGVPDVEAALAGARDIVAEIVAENAEIRGMVRGFLAQEGKLVAEMHPDAADQRTKYEQYYDFSEKAADIPSHRFLAIRRGEREKVLRVRLEVESESILFRIERHLKLDPRSPFAEELGLAVADAYRRLLFPSVESDIRARIKERSDDAAIDVFASNLRNLLLAPPLGARSVIGVDPGIRTGCKCVAMDATGKFLEAITLFLSQGEAGVRRARQDIVGFIAKHHPFAFAVGNGTGSREAEAFLRRVFTEEELQDIVLVQVNESGASVYSASDIAREEFPDLDVTIRGAISIARRLQDPLAELVKIDPKAIGVGQYQHDVHQPQLQQKLDEVVESCVNQVGVEANTASAPLLARVAGIGQALSKKIVLHRDRNGVFSDRQALLKVSGLGPRTFEQAAGFLRIRGGRHPLDGSAVHPERYSLVERMAKDLAVDLKELVGSDPLVERIDLSRYLGAEVGEPTLRDILEELRKPGRDPRTSFSAPRFQEDIQSMEDLKPGMVLEGVVTNVTAFGAFVDVGVHQDGLVHISQLSERFVKDPREVATVGEKLKVKVLEVDLARRRISLSARLEEKAAPPPREIAAPSPAREKRTPQAAPKPGTNKSGTQGRPNPGRNFSNTPFANLLKK